MFSSRKPLCKHTLSSGLDQITNTFASDLQHHGTVRIRPQLIPIEDCIWWSTDYDKGEQGMVQYDTKSDTIICVVKYTANIKPSYHSCCKHKNDIYIIDGRNGQIISFNPRTKQFITKLEIAKIGRRSRCIEMHDEIHIFNGYNNCKHLIYSIKHNAIETLNDPTTTSNITDISILKYQDKIIRFGGYNMGNSQFMDTLFISSAIKDNALKDIQWSNCWTLMKGMVGCGYITYKQHIITFGGRSSYNEYMDTIYVLNVKSDSGWIELKHIKCPMKSQYVAVLRENDSVHLLTAYNKNKITKHYAIAIETILGDCIDEFDDEKYHEYQENQENQENQEKQEKQENQESEEIQRGDQRLMLQKQRQELLRMSYLNEKKKMLELKKRRKKKKREVVILAAIAEFEVENEENNGEEHNTEQTEESEEKIEQKDTKQEREQTKERQETEEKDTKEETQETDKKYQDILYELLKKERERNETKEENKEDEQKEDQDEEDDEEEDVVYELLKQWRLTQYIPILIEEMGYDDIDDWRDLTADELMEEMQFKPGHAKRFQRKANEYFKHIDKQLENTQNTENNIYTE